VLSPRQYAPTIRDHLAGIDLEIEIAEDGERRRADRVAFDDPRALRGTPSTFNCNTNARHHETRKHENTKTVLHQESFVFLGFVVS